MWQSGERNECKKNWWNGGWRVLEGASARGLARWMNENSRMYLYIHSVPFNSILFGSVLCALFILFVRLLLAVAHAPDWSTINTSFMDFPEMVFLIKLVHFGRYSFLFCALFITRESALHVYLHYYCTRRMAFSKIYIKQSSRRSSSFYILFGKSPTGKFFWSFCFNLCRNNKSEKSPSLSQQKRHMLLVSPYLSIQINLLLMRTLWFAVAHLSGWNIGLKEAEFNRVKWIKSTKCGLGGKL